MMTDEKNFEGVEPGVLPVFQSREETRGYYNKIARVYDLMAERSEQPMREKGLESLAAQPGERVLEVGCGTGHCLAALAEAVGPAGRVEGVDLSDEMVALTRELLEKKGLAARATAAQGDAEQLSFEDNSFDAVFTSFTLELFDTPQIPVVLSEWQRVLKPGGRLVVVAVSREGKESFMLEAYEWTHRHFPNLMDCRPIYVRRAMEATGYTIEASEVGSMWVPVEIVRGVKPR